MTRETETEGEINEKEAEQILTATTYSGFIQQGKERKKRKKKGEGEECQSPCV